MRERAKDEGDSGGWVEHGKTLLMFIHATYY